MAKRGRPKKITWEDVCTQIDKSPVGFVTMTVGDLRQITGFRKLGRFVAGHIRDQMQEAGLGFYPDIPLATPRQTMPVRVFKLGSRAEAAIMAASRVDPESDAALVTLILDHADGLEALAELQTIKRIVNGERVAVAV